MSAEPGATLRKPRSAASSAERRRLLISWLEDAHAMEVGLVPILESHARDAARHPMIRERMERHVLETERHAEMLRACLARFGEEPSATKSVASRVLGSIEAYATGPFRDEEVKNGLMDYALENLEIAAYRALITAARTLGEIETLEVCREILREEEDMAAFLEDTWSTTVRDALLDVV